ncbi:hypothetical protein V6N12_054300 [Hibiscus sabdariffa]|uniref:Uncharacterized protein n=1 Tax=Hibiscus sabdariffa TaxID=183260 RepID=A0ABR2D009_9ROSI
MMKQGKCYGEVQVNMSGNQVSKNQDIAKDKGKASVKESLAFQMTPRCYKQQGLNHRLKKVFRVHRLKLQRFNLWQVQQVAAAKKVIVDSGGSFYTVMSAEIVFSSLASGLD